MFISKQEKNQLRIDLNEAYNRIGKAFTEITYLKAKIKVLEGKPAVVVAKKPKTLAQKKKQAQYMRTYMAKKKAAKLALEQA